MKTGMTRRAVFRGLGALAGGALLRRAGLADAAAGPRQLLSSFCRSQFVERHYRADAEILFCGVTIFSRRGVGGACAAIETGSSSDASATALHFVAGSDPSRCAGLNRFGVLQEAVVNSPADPRFAFAGLITDSKEEDLDAAKKALHAAARQQVKIARGDGRDGRVQTWTESADVGQPCTWRESAGLLESLAANAPRSPMREIVAGAGPFLASVRAAGLCAEEVSREPFLHAGKLYSLELKRHGATERDGTIRNQDGSKAAEFRIAYSAGDASGLPTRIEYRAKPYLRLVFEADERAAVPAIKSLFLREA